MEREGFASPAGRCRLLRTKMMHVTDAWEERAEEHPSSSASWWCLRTMGPVGPDDAPVLLEECRAGRGCFQEEE